MNIDLVLSVFEIWCCIPFFQVFIVLKAKEEYLYKPKQTFYDIKVELPRNTTFNPWSVVITESVGKVPLAYIGVLHVNASYNASAPDNGKYGVG